MESVWEAAEMKWLGDSVPRTFLSTPVTSGFLMTSEKEVFERARLLSASLLWYQQLSWLYFTSTSQSRNYSLLIRAILPLYLSFTRLRDRATWHFFTASVTNFLFD